MESYVTEIIAESKENFDALRQILVWQRDAYNVCSEEEFKMRSGSIKRIHEACYREIRDRWPEIPSQVIIKATRDVLSAYRTVRANKHKLTKPCVKRGLSIRLDTRLYSCATRSGIRITTANGRKNFAFSLYPKLAALLEKFAYSDPLIFERDGRLFAVLTFDSDAPKLPANNALGVDLGVRVPAACSDGRLIMDKPYNSRRRKVRHAKRSLQSRGTSSARRKLKKLRRKERNMQRAQTHALANEILRTTANVVVLEDLKGVKRKRHARQNKNYVSQAPFAELRRVICYKAERRGMTALLVRPHYTSQEDSVTGLRKGERRGRRFYAENGLVYDADINAACNIARRSKLPYSRGNLLAGQAVVNQPNVLKSCPARRCAAQAAPFRVR